MKYGLIGDKLGHSLSKVIYEKCDKEYDLVEINKDELESFLSKKTLTNFNVTIPYKKDIIPLLDNIQEEAKAIGAVNTVWLEDGKWNGANTDIFGMKKALKKANILIKDKNVLILGSGGTSNTAYYLCESLGAKSIKKVSRTGNLNYNNCYDEIDTDVIIDTTPVGMYPNNSETIIDLKKFKNITGVFDCVYNPLRTNLVLQAKELNINCSGGLYMLVAQAVKSMSIFDKVDVDDKLIDTIYYELLKQFSNIVLIGMPSCGKTTIGEKLAKELNRVFNDVDKMFFRYFRSKPENEIMFNGEKVFREKETSIVKKLNAGGQVIATGGGTILLKENVDFLKQNGVFVFIERAPEKLITEGRPLSQKHGIIELYKNRKPLYEKYSDIVVENEDLETAVKEVINKYEKYFSD